MSKPISHLKNHLFIYSQISPVVLPTGFEPGAPTITVHAAGVDRPPGAGHGLLEGSLDEAGLGAMAAGAGGAIAQQEANRAGGVGAVGAGRARVVGEVGGVEVAVMVSGDRKEEEIGEDTACISMGGGGGDGGGGDGGGGGGESEGWRM